MTTPERKARTSSTRSSAAAGFMARTYPVGGPGADTFPTNTCRRASTDVLFDYTRYEIRVPRPGVCG